MIWRMRARSRPIRTLNRDLVLRRAREILAIGSYVARLFTSRQSNKTGQGLIGLLAHPAVPNLSRRFVKWGNDARDAPDLGVRLSARRCATPHPLPRSPGSRSPIVCGARVF
jgi:hypothetical protein